MNVFVKLVQYQYFNTTVQSNSLFSTELKYKIFTPKLFGNDLNKNVATTMIQQFLYENPKNIHDKYVLIKKNYENIFINEHSRAEYLLQLCFLQKKYFVLYKFIRKWKMAHSTIQISCDLYMNELDPKHRKTFILYQKGRIYYFSLLDLVHIINHSLSHSSFLFLHPIHAKNPHNNVEFSKADLYNIYFQIRDNYLVIPKLIDLFFRCNFDIYYMKKHFENEIFHYTLLDYVNDYDDEEFLEDYEEMLVSFKYEDKICIDKEYPVHLLKSTMKPYVLLFLKTKYITDRQLQNNYMHELDMKLKLFVKHNPFYGQKKIIDHNHIIPHFQQTSTQYFNANKIPNNDIVNDFMSSHTYYENKYDHYIHRGNFNIWNSTSRMNIPQTLRLPPLISDGFNDSLPRFETPPPLQNAALNPFRTHQNEIITNVNDSDDSSDDSSHNGDSSDSDSIPIQNEIQTAIEEEKNDNDEPDDYDMYEKDYDW